MQLHLTAKSVKSLNLQKDPSEEPNSVNYIMPKPTCQGKSMRRILDYK